MPPGQGQAAGAEQPPPRFPPWKTKGNPSTGSTRASSRGPRESRVSARGGSSKSLSTARSSDARGSGGDRGDKATSLGDSRKGSRKDWKGDNAAPPRGGGGSKETVVEGAVLDAENMVVCVMQQGSDDAKGRAKEG